jgi:hypothetical protein
MEMGNMERTLTKQAAAGEVARGQLVRGGVTLERKVQTKAPEAPKKVNRGAKK